MQLGEHDLLNDDRDRPLQVDIAAIIIHPRYNRAQKYNDIALIRLNIRVTFNQYMRPACLPETYNTHKAHVIASGWGKTSQENKRGTNVLMKVVLEVFSDRECNASYADGKGTQLSQGILPSQQFCAGSHTEIKDACAVCIVLSTVLIIVSRVLLIVCSFSFGSSRETLVAQSKNTIRILTVCIQSVASLHLVSNAESARHPVSMRVHTISWIGSRILCGRMKECDIVTNGHNHQQNLRRHTSS